MSCRLLRLRLAGGARADVPERALIRRVEVRHAPRRGTVDHRTRAVRTVLLLELLTPGTGERDGPAGAAMRRLACMPLAHFQFAAAVADDVEDLAVDRRHNRHFGVALPVAFRARRVVA